ncbi:MAG: HAD family hydrolase [Gaiellaceae bacterium]
MAVRWASFDCYGTLADWDGGVAVELERLFGAENVPRLLARYHEVEPVLQAEEPGRSYREVLTLSLEALADEEGVDLPEGEADALARSLPGWPAFPEVRGALEELRRRGWRIAVLSNTDPDFLAASLENVGVPVDLTVVASEIGSYKPARGHWDVFYAETGADPARHAHVGASLFHDVVPCAALGIPCVWIDRLGEGPDPRATRILPDLAPLADTLDELVP